MPCVSDSKNMIDIRNWYGGDFVILGYNAARFNEVSSSSRIDRSHTWPLSPRACQAFEEEGTTLCRNVGNWLPVEAASYPRRTGSLYTAAKAPKLAKKISLVLGEETGNSFALGYWCENPSAQGQRKIAPLLGYGLKTFEEILCICCGWDTEKIRTVVAETSRES